MGCEITKLPSDIESKLEKQKQSLESIYSAFQPMEDEVHAAIQRKKENHVKIQEIIEWKTQSEAKISKFEKILKSIQNGSSDSSDDFLDINSMEILVEDQYEELMKIIEELKYLN